MFRLEKSFVLSRMQQTCHWKLKLTGHYITATSVSSSITSKFNWRSPWLLQTPVSQGHLPISDSLFSPVSFAIHVHCDLFWCVNPNFLGIICGFSTHDQCVTELASTCVHFSLIAASVGNGSIRATFYTFWQLKHTQNNEPRTLNIFRLARYSYLRSRHANFLNVIVV